MSNLIKNSFNLPDTIENISKFILVGREKLTSVRAEIRAINNLELAEEVRNQKKEEASMLSEALLDAEVKLGDLLKVIPKATPNNNPFHENDSGVDLVKPKKEVIQNLGFSQKQAERFEALANNKDLVEQVKQEARENDDIPTRTRVLDLAKERKRREQEKQEKESDYYSYVEECRKVANKYNSAIFAYGGIVADFKEFKMLSEVLDKNITQSYLSQIEETIIKLNRLQNYLKGVK